MTPNTIAEGEQTEWSLSPPEAPTANETYAHLWGTMISELEEFKHLPNDKKNEKAGSLLKKNYDALNFSLDEYLSYLEEFSTEYGNYSVEKQKVESLKINLTSLKLTLDLSFKETLSAAITQADLTRTCKMLIEQILILFNAIIYSKLFSNFNRQLTPQ
ncbi:MAG: hypothetical protein V4591_09435 [Bdellovibrionota bacterium]